MMQRIGVRLLHLVMALYLAMSGLELLDRSGAADEIEVVAETAQTMRDVRAGDDPFGLIDEIDRATDAVRRLGDAFNEAGEALN